MHSPIMTCEQYDEVKNYIKDFHKVICNHTDSYDRKIEWCKEELGDFICKTFFGFSFVDNTIFVPDYISYDSFNLKSTWDYIHTKEAYVFMFQDEKMALVFRLKFG